MVVVRKVSETDTAITVGWTKPAGQWGYVPTIDGSELLTDGKRHVGKSASKTTVKIGKVRDGKPHKYGVVVLTNGGSGAVLGSASAPPPGPGPTPPPPADNALAQSWCIMGQDPLDALGAPLYYKIAATADLGYRHWYDETFFTAARAQSRVVVPWCDCRPAPDGTPPEVAIQWMHDLGAPFWMGQAEWPAEFDAAMSASVKPRVIVGDINHLRPDQIARVKVREVLFIQEAYRNCSHTLDPGWPSWANANDGIGGNCIATYEEGECTHMGLAEYLRLGLYVAHRDSVYGPQMTATEFKALP